MKYKPMMSAAAALGLLVVGLCRPARADVISFTMSSPDNLSNLQTNSSFTIDVFVSGFNTSSADFLGADLNVPTSLITGGSVNPGAFVSDPVDDFGGSVYVDPNDSTITDASGTFFDIFEPPLNADTTLFTITLNTGNSTGSGFISFFDVFAYLDNDFSTNAAVIGTTPLAFSVQQGSGPTVAPLPSSLWGGAALMSVLGLAQLRRRRDTTKV